MEAYRGKKLEGLLSYRSISKVLRNVSLVISSCDIVIRYPKSQVT